MYVVSYVSFGIVIFYFKIWCVIFKNEYKKTRYYFQASNQHEDKAEIDNLAVYLGRDNAESEILIGQPGSGTSCHKGHYFKFGYYF